MGRGQTAALKAIEEIKDSLRYIIIVTFLNDLTGAFFHLKLRIAKIGYYLV